jgi:DNA-directed RNA polymerase specialized sigma subunit
MYYEDDLRINDISNNLNIPYRTVTSIRYTAIGKLRKLMCVNGGDTNE